LQLTPIIFIFAMVLAVASVPYAIGQTFTTMTNVFTTTGLYTWNVYSTNTVGTTTETVVSANTIASTTDKIQPGGSRLECYYDYWNITISPGTSELTGTIGPPSGQIDFYIMNQNQYYYFEHGSCEDTYPGEVAVYHLTSAYSLDWKNPPAGWYYLIFFSEKFGPNVSTVYTPFVLVATSNQVQTSTVYNVVTNQVTGSATQTVTSLQVTQLAPGVGSGLNLEIVAGIIIVVLVVVAALYYVKSRPKPEGEIRVREEQRATVTQRRTDDKQFCLECGKPLPVGSKFCNKCGATQE
jgi:ribosomal protein L40E